MLKCGSHGNDGAGEGVAWSVDSEVQEDTEVRGKSEVRVYSEEKEDRRDVSIEAGPGGRMVRLGGRM